MHRETTTPEERAQDLELSIDPGFVNRRLARTLVGPGGGDLIDGAIKRIPIPPTCDYEVQIDHIYTRRCLEFVRTCKIKSLSELLVDGEGGLFCSIEQFAPCPEIFEAPRVTSIIQPAFECGCTIAIDYSTSNVRGDTLRCELHDGGQLAVLAKFHKRDGDTLHFHPVVIGFPYLRKPGDSTYLWGQFYSSGQFECFVDDFDEFCRVREIPQPDSFEPMRDIKEAAFKRCLATILKDNVQNDWGGETSDHFTSHLHLLGKRVTASFMLKGPAKFIPMNLNSHFGKNGDQLCRLAQEPAQVLIVQHCHEITQAVRTMLSAIAVRPFNVRQYCLMDGKDSLRLLRAYDLYDEALRLSRELG